MTMGSEEGLGISIFAVCDDYGWIGEIWASFCTRKRLGEQAEAAFLNKATGLGLKGAKPWGDSDRYDLIVDSGRRLWRVQVKSTRYVGERRFSITVRGRTAAYTEDEIDFLAVYIVPLDFWYVIPVIISFYAPEVSAILSRGRGFARAISEISGSVVADEGRGGTSLGIK
jgi:hypothetical protein